MDRFQRYTGMNGYYIYDLEKYKEVYIKGKFFLTRDESIANDVLSKLNAGQDPDTIEPRSRNREVRM